MEESQITKAEFLFYLMEIRRDDPDKFMELVLEALKSERELAITEGSPSEKKLNALDAMMKHFEEKEGYENCAFIRDLANDIKKNKDGKG